MIKYPHDIRATGSVTTDNVDIIGPLFTRVFNVPANDINTVSIYTEDDLHDVEATAKCDDIVEGIIDVINDSDERAVIEVDEKFNPLYLASFKDELLNAFAEVDGHNSYAITGISNCWYGDEEERNDTLNIRMQCISIKATGFEGTLRTAVYTKIIDIDDIRAFHRHFSSNKTLYPVH